MTTLFDVYGAAGLQTAVHGIAVAALTVAANAAVDRGGVRRFAHHVTVVALAAATLAAASWADDGARIVLAAAVWIAALALLHGGSLGALVAFRVRPSIIVALSAATFIVAVPASFVVQLLSICTIAGCA